MQMVNHVTAQSVMSTPSTLSNQIIRDGGQSKHRDSSTQSMVVTPSASSNQITRNGGQRKHRDSSAQSMVVTPSASSNQIARNGGQKKLRDSTNSFNAYSSSPSKGSSTRGNNDRHRKRRYNKRRNDRGFLRVNSFEQIDELIQAAFDYQHLSPRNMADVWHRISHLLVERRGQQKQQQRQLSHELGILLTRTQNGIAKYKPVQLTLTALSMAKIIKAVHKCDNGKMNHRNMFHNLLVRDTATKQDLFQVIASVAVPLLSQFEPQGYANLAYACAIADVCPTFEQSSTLYDLIADAIVALKDLRPFKSQDFSNIVWTYATAKASHSRLFEKVADELIACHDLGSFGPQSLSNIVWAYATANVSHRGLFRKVADMITCRHLRSFSPQALSNILWAFATAKVSRPGLFEKVADELVSHRDLESFDPESLSSIAWAFTTAKASNQILLDRIADAAIVRKNGFSAQGIANILWSFSSSGLVQSQTLLFESMAPRVAALLDQCSSQHLANIAWSYAVANVDSTILFNSTFTDVLLEKMDTFNSVLLCQLYQWHLWQKEELSAVLGLPSAFEKQCYDAFVSKKVHVSIYHKEVISALRSLGLDPKEEVLTPKGFSLDAFVEVDGKEVGVRVDGPHLFMGRARGAPVGRTSLKRRLVANVEGIVLVSIPHWVWKKLGGDCFKHQNYLRDQLGMM